MDHSAGDSDSVFLGVIQCPIQIQNIRTFRAACGCQDYGFMVSIFRYTRKCQGIILEYVFCGKLFQIKVGTRGLFLL
jgi:hypothetical protein